MVHVEAIEYQNERAFQKQAGVPIIPGSTRYNKRSHQTKPRWIKKVGYGFPIPNAAVEGTYIDNKCPFTSRVSIRGRILKGLIVSRKMKNTVVIRRHYLHFIPKYNRFEKRHSNITAHCSPVFDCKVGDIATVGECRPLAKTVHFNVVHTESNEVFSNIKKHFVMF